jgi:L-methionine (R)-S-oxide reductase
MAENLIIPESADKEERYKSLIPQIKALTEGEADLIADLANICAALKYGMGFFWVGFYIVKDEELVLGPFQGPVACSRIGLGKGVCGTAWKKKESIIVVDVDAFPGHIACSTDARSEIVLPVFYPDGEVAMVLDVDSDKLADFDTVDQQFLQEIVKIIEEKL